MFCFKIQKPIMGPKKESYFTSESKKFTLMRESDFNFVWPKTSPIPKSENRSFFSSRISHIFETVGILLAITFIVSRLLQIRLK